MKIAYGTGRKPYCNCGPYPKIKKLVLPHKILGSSIVFPKFYRRLPESTANIFTSQNGP